jgi:L-threonylcarbamoyladenylate synthase
LKNTDISSEINNALNVLKAGGTILYPTDTVWGIGCDATNSDAIQKVKNIKNRPDEKSLIVLIADENSLGKYVKNVPASAWELIEFANRPLTIVFPDVVNLSDEILAEDRSAGIRVVKHPFCEGLITKFRKPIVSTSANISGMPTPAHFTEISDEILSAVDYIVNLPESVDSNASPSSIIKFNSDGSFKFIRK